MLIFRGVGPQNPTTFEGLNFFLNRAENAVFISKAAIFGLQGGGILDPKVVRNAVRFAPVDIMLIWYLVNISFFHRGFLLYRYTIFMLQGVSFKYF